MVDIQCITVNSSSRYFKVHRIGKYFTLDDKEKTSDSLNEDLPIKWSDKSFKENILSVVKVKTSNNLQKIFFYIGQSNKVAKIRNRYNQVPHLTQDTNGKVTNSKKTPQTRAKRSALSQQVTTKQVPIKKYGLKTLFPLLNI